MTVKELIAHLQTLPQDFQVAYRCCSDYAKMEAEDISVITALDKLIVQHHNMEDRIREYNSWEYEQGGMRSGLAPKFIDAVVFPGN